MGKYSYIVNSHSHNILGTPACFRVFSTKEKAMDSIKLIVDREQLFDPKITTKGDLMWKGVYKSRIITSDKYGQRKEVDEKVTIVCWKYETDAIEWPPKEENA